MKKIYLLLLFLPLLLSSLPSYPGFGKCYLYVDGAYVGSNTMFTNTQTSSSGFIESGALIQFWTDASIPFLESWTFIPYTVVKQYYNQLLLTKRDNLPRHSPLGAKYN